MQNDKTGIEQARHEFGQKKFENALKIYNVISPQLFSELDRQIIQHCKNVLNIKDDKASSSSDK